MGNDIINEAIEKINQEREVLKQQELIKIQESVINPKFVTFENEFTQALELENKRHENSISNLQTNLNTKKQMFIESVEKNLEKELEEKYKYSFKIAQLEKLLDSEA